MNLWHITEDSFDPTPKRLHSQETVFTIGNGYFCTRGTFEEGYPKESPATLLFGVFDAVPIAKEELANAPDWTPVGIFFNKERFRLDRGKILDYKRSLDLQSGTLSRTVTWESEKGLKFKITSERFASMANEHVGALRISVTNENAEEVEVALSSIINTAVGNYDLMHWDAVDQGQEGELLWLKTETKKTQVELVQSMSFTTDFKGHRKEFIDSYIAPCIRIYGKLKQGETIAADKLVTMYTSRDSSDAVRDAIDTHLQALEGEDEDKKSSGAAYDRLYAGQQETWQEFWKRADIVIEGDDEAQVGIRYNIYQLRINASDHDSRYSIAAKGLTGFGYRGHVFHDTEIFMLPFFTYVMPEIARNLLLYRYHLLPAARKKAASNGYEGAQFPWESTLDGEETTPASIIHPETSEVIPVLNGFIEFHITASIARATQQYWQISGDDDFMKDYGGEILLSTAMFWASRAEKNEEKGDYEITNVIGPDEWHEHVNNNAFTNYMARWNIQQGLAVYEWLRVGAPGKLKELEQNLGITQEKLEHWQEVAEKLKIPYNPKTKLFEQFDGFFKLERLDQSQYEGRQDSYQGILGIHAVQKYQIVKQADVLMLLTVLERDFDMETKRANWDYYYPITDHDYGSSLTPALHTILAAQLGEVELGYTQFEKGLLVDLKNLRGNTPEGIHAACAGAVWQAVVFGFAGLSVDDEGYKTKPVWPDDWSRLAFSFKLRGEQVNVDLHR